MDRPLADKRPIGPFAQSEAFDNKFIRTGSEDTFDVTDEGVIAVRTSKGSSPDFRMIEDMVQFFIEDELSGFLDAITEYSGVVSAEPHDVHMTKFYIDGLEDDKVTTGQLETALMEYLNREGAPVSGVSVYMH